MEIHRPAARQPMPPEARKVFEGEIFDVYQWQQKLFDGSSATYEVLKRSDTVSTVPVLPDGQILLLDEEQAGARRAIDIPMGRAEEGEDALTTAKRELLEETGYEADEWMLLDARQPVQKIDWAVFTFVAKGLRKVADMNLDPGEKIELMPVTFERFQELVLEKGVGGPEMVRRILEAKLDPANAEELSKLLSPH